MVNEKVKHIGVELGSHLPFSVFGVSMGIVLIGILSFFATLVQGERLMPQAADELFHIFHPIHVLFSSMATTAMFWKHERNLLKAIVIGVFGGVVVCGFSDIGIPYLGGLLLHADMHMHVCLLEHPGMIMMFVAVGILSGLFIAQNMEYSTESSHGTHVFVSSAASLLYLIAFGVQDWAHAIGSIFFITIIAVMIPCCLSDIVLPLALLRTSCGLHEHKKHG